MVAFTRRQDGRLYGISHRLVGGSPSQDSIRDHRRAWKTNLGLPEGRRLTIEGTCDCSVELDRDPHPASLTVRLSQGYADGHFSCAKQPRRVPVAGCLSERDATFIEYGIDDVPTARLYFRWKLEGEVLELDGYRCESEHMEMDNVKLRCSVPAQEPSVTAPR